MIPNESPGTEAVPPVEEASGVVDLSEIENPEIMEAVHSINK